MNNQFFYHENNYIHPNTQTPKHPNTQTPKHPNTQTPTSKRLKQLVLSSVLALFVISVSYGQDESRFIFDHITMPHPPLSNTPVQNNSCRFTGFDNNGSSYDVMPVRRNIQRCDRRKTDNIWVRPQMVSGVSFPLYTTATGIYTGRAQMRLTVKYFVNGFEVNSHTTGRVTLGLNGFSANVTTDVFNNLAPVRSYIHTGNHEVKTRVEIESFHGRNFFLQRIWKTSYVLETCHSTVSNVNGVPNFSVLTGNFINNVWPQHYEVCTNGATITTSNTCNNSFNLFVAEINQNWQRPEVKEAQRWFTNTQNATINLQQFTLGFFNNTNFQVDGPFVMEGGTVTVPNQEGVTGTRYFMIQVGITAPNWSVATKVICIINCLVEPGDTNIEMLTTVYDLDEFMDEFPELEEQVKEMVEEFAIVFPNPTENLATFRYSASKGKLLSLQILDQRGNLYPLPTETRMLENFYETPEMDISHLPQGIYTILAEYENSETIEKIRFNKK